MAALTKHGLFTTSKRLFSPKNLNLCNYATKAEKKKGIDRKVGPKIDSSAESLAAKGFLRPQKEYTPPADLNDRLGSIFTRILGSTNKEMRLDDIKQRFQVFKECFDEFQHPIPNSLLYTIETVGDIQAFYATPVDTITPLDKLKNMQLPENLHVQYEYHRFNPDTDTMFKGITAFPGRSTIITGLKYKNKYKGHDQRNRLPFAT